MQKNRGPLAGPENRQSLIDAGRAEFIAHGASVPLSRIAKRAGVGQGSLYRHFPNRFALAVAVFEQNLQEIRRRVAVSSSPYSVFLSTVEQQASEASVIIDLVASGEAQAEAESLRRDLRELVTEVFDAASAAGELAPHVTAVDLLSAVQMLALPVAKAPAGEHGAVAERVRQILDAWFLRGS
ncbi:TetR/AcrR family transcriptional regulator [Nesterenkonia salmonea]|uniref:TetR/AcrR family transcriptional regulator n=1 Tax=Nesterenkonia salmonea TaxID=1804987 RepID=UPI001409050B|nr:TetR/AcrR family transcriptional regulator [Nesterenkonia salmonea]